MPTSRTEIVGTMTVGEAVPNWPDPRSGHLKYWAEAFGVCLQDLHIGHIRTYQQERGTQVAGAQVDIEVDAVFALLKQIGLGDDILAHYQSFTQTGNLTPAEISSLSAPVRRYIDKLIREISELRSDSQRKTNWLQRMNWGRSR
jgi:hypothetical protein